MDFHEIHTHMLFASFYFTDERMRTIQLRSTCLRANVLNASLVMNINKSFKKSLDSKVICQACKFGKSACTCIKIYQHGEIEYGV